MSLKRIREPQESAQEPSHRPADYTYTSPLNPGEEADIGEWFPVIFSMQSSRFNGTPGAIATDFTTGSARGSRQAIGVSPLVQIFREQDYIRIPPDITSAQLRDALLLTLPMPYVMDFQYPPHIRAFHLQVLARFNPDLVHGLTTQEIQDTLQACTARDREIIADFSIAPVRVFRIRF